MTPGIWQIALVVVLAVVLFGGRGKISSLMGDAAKGIRAFKDGLKDEDKQDSSSESGSLSSAEKEKES